MERSSRKRSSSDRRDAHLAEEQAKAYKSTFSHSGGKTKASILFAVKNMGGPHAMDISDTGHLTAKDLQEIEADGKRMNGDDASRQPHPTS